MKQSYIIICAALRLFAVGLSVAMVSAAFAQSSSIRVNAGGPAYTDSGGNAWTADNGFNTGVTSTEPSSVVITGTTDPILFKTLRYDNATVPDLIYTFTIPNGAYTARLYFAETSSAVNAAGKRVFDIDIQNQRVFEDVDIYAQAGGQYKALMLSAPITVSAGQVTIHFVAQTNLVRVNAIEIFGDTQAPTTPGTPTFSGVTASAVTVNWTAATDNVAVTAYRVSRGGTLLTTVPGLTYTDSGLSAGTSYTYSVAAVDAAGNVSPTTSASVATASGGGATTVRINAGGASYTDASGNVWSADTGSNTGSVTTTTATVTGTTDPQLFKSERYDLPAAPELTYTIPIANGSYFVRLYFAETYTPNKGVGLRVFDVDVQGTRAFENVDIYSLAGGANKALVLQAPAIVTNGQITIGFVHQVENPKVNAIEIIPAGARINAGGPSYVDSSGLAWAADNGSNTGSTTTTTITVSGTSDPQLFKTERYDLPAAPELTYTLSQPNGTYLVKLYFAETYSPTKGVGLRVFDVNVQGARAFEDVDIFALAGGGNKALVLQTTAEVTGGQLAIQFLHQVENPKVNAIEVIPYAIPAESYFTSFEASSGFALGSLQGQGGWSVSGVGTVVNATASAGSYSVKIPAGVNSVMRQFSSLGAGTTTYVDFFLKPVFTGSLDFSSLIDIGVAQVGFLRSGSGGQLQVLTANSQGAAKWLAVGAPVSLNSAGQPSGWQRLTLRINFASLTWDLFLNGSIVASALPLNAASAYVSSFTVEGSTSTDTYFDDIYLGLADPLPNDAIAPSAPTSITAPIVTSTAVDLFWNSSSGPMGIAGYKVYRNGGLIATISGMQTYYTDRSVSAGTAYSYVVQAFNSGGVLSAQSSAVTATTSVSTPPSLEVFSPLK